MFLEYGYFVDKFLVITKHKTELVLGVISMHLASFLKVNVQNGNISLGLQKFQIFLEYA